MKVEKSEVANRAINGLRLNRAEVINGFSTSSNISPVFVTNEVPIVRTFRSDDVIVSSYFYVPQGKFWRVKHIFMKFVSTATVGNRTPIMWYRISFDGSSNLYDLWRRTAANAHAASTTRYYTYGIGLPELTATAGYEQYNLPDLWLPQGSVFRVTDGASIDAADTYQVTVIIEEISLNSNFSSN